MLSVCVFHLSDRETDRLTDGLTVPLGSQPALVVTPPPHTRIDLSDPSWLSPVSWSQMLCALGGDPPSLGRSLVLSPVRALGTVVTEALLPWGRAMGRGAGRTQEDAPSHLCFDPRLLSSGGGGCPGMTRRHPARGLGERGPLGGGERPALGGGERPAVGGSGLAGGS